MIVRLMILFCAVAAAIGVALGAPAPQPRGAPGTLPRAPTARPRGGLGTLGPYLQRRPSYSPSRPTHPSRREGNRNRGRFYPMPYYSGPIYLYPWGSFSIPPYSFTCYEPLVPVPVYIPWVPFSVPNYVSPDEWSMQGNVQLHVEPADATVIVDGTPIAKAGQAVLSLPVGLHHFEIISPGYRPWVLDLEVKEGVRYRLEPRLQPEPQQEGR